MDTRLATHRDQVWSRLLSCSCVLLLAALPAAGCGGSTKGKSLLQQYQDALKVPDPALRSQRLAAIAQKQHEAGDLMGSENSLSAAKEAAYALTDPASRAIALTKLATAYVRLEQSPRAMQSLLVDAAKAAEAIVDADAKVPVLADLAVATGQHLKDTALAAAYLTTAQDAAHSITLPLTKVTALTKIARAYGKLEQPDDANGLIDAGLELARSQQDPRTKCDCLAEVAAVQSTLKQAEPSAATFAEAEQAATAIQANDSRAYALLNLAEKSKAAGKTAESRRLLSEAETFADKLRDTSVRNPLLDEINATRRN